MRRPDHVCGPIAFKYAPIKINDRIGTKPTKCDVPGCVKPAPWTGTALGWDIGIYCTAHKQEFLGTANAILHPKPEPTSPAVAA